MTYDDDAGRKGVLGRPITALVLFGRGYFLLDPADDCPHRLMGVTKLSRHCSGSLSLHPRSNVGPTLLRNLQSFRHYGMPPNTQPLSQAQESLRIQEWHVRQFHHVYLAEAIPSLPRSQP